MKEKGKMVRAYDAVMEEMDEAIKGVFAKAAKLVSTKNAGVIDPELMMMIAGGMNTCVELKNYFMDLSESIDKINDRLDYIERKVDDINSKEDDANNKLVDIKNHHKDIKNEFSDINRYISGLHNEIDRDKKKFGKTGYRDLPVKINEDDLL
jgi:predicted nuclease with TOPRIM domain